MVVSVTRHDWVTWSYMHGVRIVRHDMAYTIYLRVYTTFMEKEMPFCSKRLACGDGMSWVRVK